jgi:hypothetical protein
MHRAPSRPAVFNMAFLPTYFSGPVSSFENKILSRARASSYFYYFSAGNYYFSAGAVRGQFF